MPAFSSFWTCVVNTSCINKTQAKFRKQRNPCACFYAAADADAFGWPLVLLLLPTGRPRFFASTIHAGGRPRRRPRPRASRSRLNIASSNCSRSWRNSSRIFETSIWDSCFLFRNPTSPQVQFQIRNKGASTPSLQTKFLPDRGRQSKWFVLNLERRAIIPYQNRTDRESNLFPARLWKFDFSNENKMVILSKSTQFPQSIGAEWPKEY